MIYCAKTKLNKNRTIYIENPLKSYDFSGFSGPSDWFRTSGLVAPTGIENFFRTFLTVFYRFRSYSVTLVPSFDPPFPPVPRASVVIHVVKNASRPVSDEDSPMPSGKRFAFQIVCIVTLRRGLCRWFLRGWRLSSCGAIDKEYHHAFAL